jgi:hypothetical protein
LSLIPGSSNSETTFRPFCPSDTTHSSSSTTHEGSPRCTCRCALTAIFRNRIRQDSDAPQRVRERRRRTL